jgi:hypothetical protein
VHPIKCPYCTHSLTTAVAQCPSCERDLPKNYLQICQQAPPLWLVTAGFSGHGKTTYLSALTLKLENLGRKLSGTYHDYFDEYTHEVIKEKRREAQTGEQPPPSAVTEPRPLYISLYQLPSNLNRTLVMYDVAGEVFTSLMAFQSYVQALPEVQTIWMQVSLSDLEEDAEGNTLPSLFQSYQAALLEHGAELRNHTVIVIYTKADTVQGFPGEVWDYLTNDPFLDLLSDDPVERLTGFSLSEYVQGMQRLSKVLERYTDQHVSGGTAFINMIRGKGMQLHFCAVSALGQSPDPGLNRVLSQTSSHRVLDPFFWTLWLSAPSEKRVEVETPGEVMLVLDASPESKALYEQQLAQPLWEALKERGYPAKTYYLGRSRVVSHQGQPPPTEPARRPLQRLIGPILEQSPSGRAVVVTAGAIRDLADFRPTDWKGRLVLVTTDDEVEESNWPLTFHYRVGDRPQAIVDLLAGNPL